MRMPAVVLAIVLAVPAFAAAATCGDGVVEPPEQCDEGAANGTSGSDCTAVCEEVIPALRIPGGGSRDADCQMEGVLDLAAPTVDRRGLPDRKQTCVDNDPTCDRDPSPDWCVLAFWVCVGGADTRIGCPAQPVVSLEIRKPGTREIGWPADMRAELHAKLGAFVPTGPGEVCSGRMLLRIPATRKLTKVKLRTRSTNRRPDSDTFKLRCEAPL